MKTIDSEKNYKTIALVPARKGSKGLPGKNCKLLNGKPLIEYTIEEAITSNCFDEIILSTDDDKIVQIGKQYSQIRIEHRKSELAKDDSTVTEVLYDMLQRKGRNYDIYAILLPTQPFRSSEDIKTCLGYLKIGLDAVISISMYKVSPQFAITLSHDNLVIFEKKDSPLLSGKTKRQQQAPFYHHNGAIFLGWIESFLKHKSLFKEKVKAYIMPWERSIDIDDAYDFRIAESLMNGKTG